jgi:Ubiquitin family
LKKKLNIPPNKQRLIFQGKLLQDLEKLSTYKIIDDNVVHLVAKIAEEDSSQNQTNSSNQPQNQPQLNLEDQIIGNIGNLMELPFLRPNRRQRRRRSKLYISFSSKL